MHHRAVCVTDGTLTSHYSDSMHHSNTPHSGPVTFRRRVLWIVHNPSDPPWSYQTMESPSQEAQVHPSYLLMDAEKRTDIVADQEARFLKNLAVSPTYPDTLLQQGEDAAVVKERREHYAQNKGRVFDGLAGKREPLVIIDFGTAPDFVEGAGHEPASIWKRKGKLRLIRDVEGLRAKLSWPSAAESTTEAGSLVKDPPLRVM
ncbi:hypothetical protein LX32DRAFT_636150 [Colletotrichum zoysiae]|uniref:Uncharacterized protein n=1 Tax=Colletotrichum zoysiae TaxID=1216348 RepID=A0AAD9M7X9_9PEZI|nr:hypothetical protein LX32DRAFT_636150 [Colletotrichum zoysiae]